MTGAVEGTVESAVTENKLCFMYSSPFIQQKLKILHFYINFADEISSGIALSFIIFSS